MQRFCPTLESVKAPADAVPLAEAALQLSQAVQNDELVVRETDLDAVQTYLKTQKNGTLHLELVTADGNTTADFPITYGRTRLGEFIVAWSTDSIKDAMTNGSTSLLTAEGERFFFDDVRELYYDETKAFMVCRPVFPAASP
jgi:hypothetical protein